LNLELKKPNFVERGVKGEGYLGQKGGWGEGLHDSLGAWGGGE